MRISTCGIRPIQLVQYPVCASLGVKIGGPPPGIATRLRTKKIPTAIRMTRSTMTIATHNGISLRIFYTSQIKGRARVEPLPQSLGNFNFDRTKFLQQKFHHLRYLSGCNQHLQQFVFGYPFDLCQVQEPKQRNQKVAAFAILRDRQQR